MVLAAPRAGEPALPSEGSMPSYDAAAALDGRVVWFYGPGGGQRQHHRRCCCVARPCFEVLAEKFSMAERPRAKSLRPNLYYTHIKVWTKGFSEGCTS